MAVNVSNRVGNVKNNRSHARNASKARQNLNLQVVRLDDGSKVRMYTREKRPALTNQKAA